MIVSTEECDRRRAVVERFINATIDGDVKGFISNAFDIDWPGAWLDISRALRVVPRLLIDDAIRFAFLAAWRGSRDANIDGPWMNERPIGNDWDLTRDLGSNTDLLVHCLKLLTPNNPFVTPPLVLYRGQSLADHEAGIHGVWWTTYPLFAETFARAPFRSHVGQGAVVVAVRPSDAIIHRMNRMEYLLDPSKLSDVHLLDTPSRNTAEELAMTQRERDARSRLLGVPGSEQTALVHEWLVEGMPLSGLKVCRDERLASIEAEAAARRQGAAS